MKILAIDIGGTNVKILASGQKVPRRFPSGPTMTPAQLVVGVKELAKDWKYDVISVGFPAKVVNDRIAAEPNNLGRGWKGFDFRATFGRPVKVINDAAMQALGSWKTGTILFLGLGTGLGSAMIVNGHVVPMELGQLPFRKGIAEDYLGTRGLKRLGKKKWREAVTAYIACLVPAFQFDQIILGGGNVKHLKKLPAGCRMGTNANAFAGGFRLWETKAVRPGKSRSK